jgi:hypothetical protein
MNRLLTRPDAPRCGGCTEQMTISGGAYVCRNARCPWTARKNGHAICPECNDVVDQLRNGRCIDCEEYA